MAKSLFFWLGSILIIGLFWAGRANAQTPLTIETLQIELWPEYDQPGVLVIYRITLALDTALPATFSLRIPAASGEPNAVAKGSENGSLINLDYQRQVAGNWATIIISTDSPIVHLEYYDNSLERIGSQRSFNYIWTGAYPVNDLEIIVQQPIGADALQTTPNLSEVIAGVDGLTYYKGNFGNFPEGTEFQFKLEYIKSNDQLSIQQQTQSEPIAILSDQQPENFLWLPWVFGIVGLGLVGYGVWKYLNGREKPKKRPRIRRRKRTVKVEKLQNAAFCHHCGIQSNVGDNFCRSCGAELKK